MEKLTDLVTRLEKILVNEFHLIMTLHALTKEERLALVQSEITSIETVVKRKEAALDELSQLDHQRRTVIGELAAILGLRSPYPTLLDLSTVIESESGERFRHLGEGIIALNTDIRYLTRGNTALVENVLE